MEQKWTSTRNKSTCFSASDSDLLHHDGWRRADGGLSNDFLLPTSCSIWMPTGVAVPC